MIFASCVYIISFRRGVLVGSLSRRFALLRVGGVFASRRFLVFPVGAVVDRGLRSGFFVIFTAERLGGFCCRLYSHHHKVKMPLLSRRYASVVNCIHEGPGVLNPAGFCGYDDILKSRCDGWLWFWVFHTTRRGGPQCKKKNTYCPNIGYHERRALEGGRSGCRWYLHGLRLGSVPAVRFRGVTHNER